MYTVNHLGPDRLRQALAQDVRTGLTSTPKWLASKWFYDARGSELFTQITRLPEYYPTRREAAILREHAADIAARTGAETLVELGSGVSEKSVLLLDALGAAGTLKTYSPVDVDASTLDAAARQIAAGYPGLAIWAVCADFERHLAVLPRIGRRLVAFLGGTIGNLDQDARTAFLEELRAGLAPGDSVLIGADLVKDTGRLVAAYDDAAGVTAAFNRNVLNVLNRELGADFIPQAFEHVALYDGKLHRIEMRLRATRPMRVRFRDLDLSVSFRAGEEMRTEISAKFHRYRLEGELLRSGFALSRWYSDPGRDFGLALAYVPERRGGDAGRPREPRPRRAPGNGADPA
ncbi:L-histidine N(alpha)-methyltransferase [Sphaerisporangium sp. TRM90804]|uniref:L-histidine N(alpha)-methyltransferase n=1 Tax=Sphaerisporangium sp. TRM90804 TaxID=3031113 RepID=UPI002448E769|nr:L-histidine N(alpha)-methyltransferase [Sphaerisporangium sp. TRM90804]MDH2426276.1 L-histidine N(alpha)-methyltransferase [Sphaerisporangium sp. TRM90804]